MMHLISVVALPAFLLSLLMFGLKGDLFSSAPGVIACQVGGLAVMIWARAVFPKGSFRVAVKPASSAIILQMDRRGDRVIRRKSHSMN
jgi:hypothetical protein